MLENAKQKAIRATVGSFIDKAIDSYQKKDRDGFRDQLLKLTDYGEKLFGGFYRKEVYQSFRRELKDPNSKWVNYVFDVFEDIDPHVLKTLVVNLGYTAGFYGNKKTYESKEKYGVNIPWTILMDPTTACNLRCIGCRAAEYGYKYNLGYDTMARIIREGRELGIYFYMFTGGEPLVKKDEILRLAEEFDDCAFNIYTNATLIDEEFCQKVQELGNIVFSVSVEGYEETNDARRGEGSYDKVMHAFDLMKKYGLVYGTSICYTSQNYRVVTSDAFLDTLVDKGVKFNRYFHYMPVGKGANTDLLLNPEQRAYIHDRIRQIRGLHGGKPIYTIDFQNDGEYVGGCIAGGRRYFHINANGDCEPCVFIHYSDANIKDHSLLEVLGSPLFKSYQEGQPFNKNHLRPCPMLENPGQIKKLVEKTNAKSTDYEAPEDVNELIAKTVPYAKDWKDMADEIWAHSPKNPDNILDKEEATDYVEKYKDDTSIDK